MNSYAKSKRTSKRTKAKFCACALLMILAASLPLTGCVTTSRGGRESLQIYQPRILALKAGTPVQTTEGIYTPQTDEIWHSQAAYTQVENQLINALAALQAARTRGE